MAASRVSAAPVTNATLAVAPGARRTRRRRLKTGSSTGPVVPDRRAPRSSAAGLAGVRPRPRNRARSVSYSTGPSAAETWTAQIGFWSAARGRRRASRAPGSGDELRLQEQLREGRVGLVGAAVVQAHLGVAGQVELAGPIRRG